MCAHINMFMCTYAQMNQVDVQLRLQVQENVQQINATVTHTHYGNGNTMRMNGTRYKIKSEKYLAKQNRPEFAIKSCILRMLRIF